MRNFFKKIVVLILCFVLFLMQNSILAEAAFYLNEEDEDSVLISAETITKDETIVYWLNSSMKPYTLIANKVNELWVGEQHRFTVAANQRKEVSIMWSSSNMEVASIDKITGELVAHTPGTTRITMRDKRNHTKSSYILTVVPEPILPRIPEKWYTWEDTEIWNGDYSGVELIFNMDYATLFEKCSMLWFPDELDGKSIIDIRTSTEQDFMSAFPNLKLLRLPEHECWYSWNSSNNKKVEVICPQNCTRIWRIGAHIAHIPEAVEVVSDLIFNNRDQIRIPSGVKVIGDEISFDEYYEGIDRGVLEFCVDGNNTNYYSIFGVLFSYPLYDARDMERKHIYYHDDMYGDYYVEGGKNILVAYPSKKEGSAYRIPYGVERIGEYAFSGCKLKKIVLSDSVKEIGGGAFTNCELLTEIVIPSTVKIIEDNFYTDTIEDCTGRLMIITPKGSAAEAYAIEHGIRYRNE
ncbi:MAG: leucine-rich repeat protein [Lachnospiraceae bacterium]|nr:leucine-rich repeat protein [Lachnospiraceae bacterium]